MIKCLYLLFSLYYYIQKNTKRILIILEHKLKFVFEIIYNKEENI